MLKHISRFSGLRQRQQSGFTMLEALIALLVFSIGMLGLAAMYNKSMMVTHSAYLRSLASIQAMDMAERIRANVYYDHDHDHGDGNKGYELRSASQITASEMEKCAPCTPAELRDRDIYNWVVAARDNYFKALFEDASIKRAGIDNEDYVISLKWRERTTTSIKPIEFTYRVAMYKEDSI